MLQSSFIIRDPEGPPESYILLILGCVFLLFVGGGFIFDGSIWWVGVLFTAIFFGFAIAETLPRSQRQLSIIVRGLTFLLAVIGALYYFWLTIAEL